MTEPPTEPPARPDDDAPDEQGGGPSCDLHRVCDACGALEDGPPAPACVRCGAPRTG